MMLTAPQRTECQGLFGWIFGHKMVARYSTKLPLASINGQSCFAQEIIEAAKEKHYVCEVCTRCGSTIDLR